jgi:pyridoxamine 5'-phosphate oxidase
VISLPTPPPNDPLVLVGEWFDDAIRRAVQRHPNAMTLATVNSASRPSARVILIKDLSRSEGYVTFYSHYESRKARELDANANAAGVLHWDKLGRQIRFEGCVARSPVDESDAYFATRPTESQLNAWVSEQSRPLADMSMLELRRLEKTQELSLAGEHIDGDGIFECGQIPRPQFWGGYRFWFSAIEAWQEGKNRYHDRLRYERELTQDERSSFVTGPWTWQRLQP